MSNQVCFQPVGETVVRRVVVVILLLTCTRNSFPEISETPESEDRKERVGLDIEAGMVKDWEMLEKPELLSGIGPI